MLKFTRRRIDSSVEEKIVTAAIMSDAFLKQIYTIYDPAYLKSPFAQRVMKWAIEYYESYEKAPKNHIKDIYDIEKNKIEEAEEKIIAAFLTKLSQQYEMETQEINDDYYVDTALKYFELRELEITSGNVQKLIEVGKVDEAKEQFENYKKVVRQTSGWYNPFDKKNIIATFEDSNEILFSFPGQLGEMIGGFERGWLFSVVGSFKRGKCISEGTKIQLADGTQKNIEDIRNNDLIFSVDDNYKMTKQKVLGCMYQGEKQTFLLRTRTGREIFATKNHPFLTPTGWKKLEDIKPDDYIAVPKNYKVESDILWDKVVIIEKKEVKKTYDLSIEKIHNFIANDIIVHNSFMLQEIAVQALLKRLKVVYVSLEMKRKNLDKRLYKRLCAMAEGDRNFIYPAFDCEKNQSGECKKPERKNKIRLLTDDDEIPEFDPESDYKPCCICNLQHGLNQLKDLPFLFLQSSRKQIHSSRCLVVIISG